MNTKDLRCYQIVYEERNINKAAEKLFISPQGLGRIIRKQEEEWNTTFFIRTKHELIPTESGKIFYERSIPITRRLHQIQEEINQAETDARRIRMGYAIGVLKALPVDAISELMQRHPEILCQWDEYENDEVIRRVAESELECGFIIGKPDQKELGFKLIRHQPVAVYVWKGHPLFEKETVFLSDLNHQPLLTMNERFHIFDKFVEACKSAGFAPDIRAKTMDGQVLMQLASKKIGLAVSPVFYSDYPENLKELPISDCFTWDIYGIYRSDTSYGEIIQEALQLFYSDRS